MYEEVVNGIVIGGDYGKKWALYYDGRFQGKEGYAKTDEEAIEEGKKKLQEIKNELGEAFIYIYPDPKWEIRIWD